MHRPNFIGIGAVKAATSWLYYALNTHPDVWMPPIKELHFFDRKEDSPHIRQILFKGKDYLLSRNRWRSSSKKPTYWNFKYFCSNRNSQYYSKLFSSAGDQICGEITPSYATSTIDTIAEVKDLLPELKIIYLLRDPIDRDWSQLCMTIKNAHNLEVSNLSDKDIIQFYEDKFYQQSSYVDNVQNWSTAFDDEKVFIGYYDQIVESPELFLKKLFSFLDISTSTFNYDDAISVKTLNSFSQSISKPVHYYLAQKEHQNLVKIHNAFDNEYTGKWLQKADHILSNYAE